MLNKISQSKLFDTMNKKFKIVEKFSKFDVNQYRIPKEYIMDKINSFKSFKIPFNNDIIRAFENDEIVLVDLSMSPDPLNKTGNVFAKTNWPKSLFNMSIISGKKITTIIDLSYKGKYVLNERKQPIHYDIPDLTLFYFILCGYVTHTLMNNPLKANNPELYIKVAEIYALILSKLIDKKYPILSTSTSDSDKLIFLCQVFCMQNMFNIPKDEACKKALSSKRIMDAKNIENECLYYRTNVDIMVDVDYNERFPIDNFCDLLAKEFQYIASDKFNYIILSMLFTDVINKNGIFALEHSVSFLNMVILSKGMVGIYNDFQIKRYTEIIPFDIIKELYMVIK